MGRNSEKSSLPPLVSTVKNVSKFNEILNNNFKNYPSDYLPCKMMSKVNIHSLPGEWKIHEAEDIPLLMDEAWTLSALELLVDATSLVFV